MMVITEVFGWRESTITLHEFDFNSKCTGLESSSPKKKDQNLIKYSQKKSQEVIK